MEGLFGKLGFIHRRLWAQDGLYRAALLFGPAPLVGVVLAASLWACLPARGEKPAPPPRWATPVGAENWSTHPGPPQALQPARPLPPIGADGALAGYEPGWRVTANSARVNPTMDVTVSPSPLTGFLLDGPRIEVAQLMAQKPEAPLYVGVGSGLLAVRTAGIYAVTARLERPAGPVAQCLTRLGFGPYRIVSNFGVDMVSDIATTFNVARFDLQPGLYPIEWAFGCWHEGAETALGRLTVLIGHPGEPAPVLARADDIVRPRRTSP